MKLKLGTRRSLLAMAQSGWVAKEIEKRNPGVQIELVGIETSGDKILDIPLSKIEGKEFFVAELDKALLSKEVDFCVHSMKDLSLDRPKEFIIGAIPPRANPRDVVLFAPEILETIRSGRTIKIGTSSPRRLENIPAFLKKALPRFSVKEPDLNFIEIRGNVNTRLSRVHEPEQSEKHLDGVVLALAGLSRLYVDEKGKTELDRLLKGVKSMILPLSHNPTAPAQGALAVECRRDDSNTLSVLRKLHDPSTEKLIVKEREILSEWGGGCHQKLGATAFIHENIGELLIIKGEHPDGKKIASLRWELPKLEKIKTLDVWNGRKFRSDSALIDELSFDLKPKNNVYYLTHSRALTKKISFNSNEIVWTSGANSWFRLAERGVWVQACTEELGVPALKELMDIRVLRNPEKVTVLTHEDAIQDWENRGFDTFATYRIPESKTLYDESVIHKLKNAKLIFWSSASQYEMLKNQFRADALHFCGLGKSAEKLRPILKEKLHVFPNEKEWLNWLNIK